MNVSRRSLLGGSAAAAAGTLLPIRTFSREAAAAPASEGTFGYGVASGDPTATSVIIWTRATPAPVDGVVAAPGSGLGDPVRVRWTVCSDEEMTCPVASGEVMTDVATDHTVKIDVTGLDPYTRYWYQFSTDSDSSIVGRTQTAPDEPGETHALRFAQVSCANYTGGYFTVYRALAERDDIDFVLHLGDYVYEYGNADDRYGPDALAGDRDHEPDREMRELEDYRLRYAQYRADADLRQCHQRHPFITIFDDHEITNNAWADGAENHQDGEGDYAARMATALQVYQEWMPIRMPETGDQAAPHQGLQFFRRFTFGDLADLSVVETRQNRSEQVSSFVLVGTPEVNDQLNDPDRHIMEPEQMQWLKDGITTQRSWHLVGNQVMVSPLGWPGQYLGLAQGSVAINGDAWDGYRHDQTQLLSHMASQPLENGDTVILTGDIHSTWVENLVGDPGTQMDGTVEKAGAVEADPTALVDQPEGTEVQPKNSSELGLEVQEGQIMTTAADASIPPGVSVPLASQTPEPTRLDGGAPAGVEFVCPSVTSDGFYEIVRGILQGPLLSIGAVELAGGILKMLNPSLEHFDGIGHGFALIDVTPERVQADYHYLPRPRIDYPDPRLDDSATTAHASSWQTLAGTREVIAADSPVGERSDEPRIAECVVPSQTPTPSETATPSHTPTQSPEPSVTMNPTPTGDAAPITADPTASGTPAPTTPSSTPAPTTPSGTPVPTLDPTGAPIASATPTPGPTTAAGGGRLPSTGGPSGTLAFGALAATTLGAGLIARRNRLAGRRQEHADVQERTDESE